jgi:putative phosphoesterase
VGVRDPFGTASPSADVIEFLDGLHFDVLVQGDGKVVVVVHGSPWEDMEFVTRRNHPASVLRDWIELIECDVLVVGHTHDPMVCRTDSGIVVNPGSVVSAPFVSTSHSFALLDLATLAVSHHNVETGALIEVKPWPDDESA